MTLSSPYPDVEIPDVPLAPFVLRHAGELADKPALIDAPSGRAMTYGELSERVRALAAGLAERGFGKGDVLALFTPNVPDFAVVFHAVVALGGVLTTINSLATAKDVARQLEDSGARMLVTVTPFLERAAPAAAEAGIAEVFVIGPEGAPGAPALDGLLAGGEPPAVEIDPRTDLAVLPYSSGTSGLPKGVMLTHRNLVANIEQIGALHRVSREDTLIGVLPFFHIYGMVVILNLALARGATVVTMPRFELGPFLATLEEHAVTRAHVVPPIVLALAKHPSVAEHDLGALQIVFSGAAPLGEELQKAASERLGCPVVQGYGMTEASPVTHVTPDDAVPGRPGSVGVLVPNTTSRLVDPDSGEDVDAGDPGEVWIRGPQVMAGYLNNTAATAAMLDDEGWLRTGDVGVSDPDGYLTIVDRVKELIKYKGYQVAPAELEAVLVTHPKVADCAVIASPDEEAGEVPKAFVVLSGDASAEEVTGFVEERVAPYKRVRRIEFVEEIPKSPSGKILRRLLVERDRAAPA